MMANTTTDFLQRFLLPNCSLRGAVVYLEQTYQTIMEQHAYPEGISKLLGEALLSSLLLSTILKSKGQLTLQFQGGEHLSLLIAKCNQNLQIRGLAQFSSGATVVDMLQDFMHGKLMVTLQNTLNPQAYQSQIPLLGHPIATALEYYFSQSEQIHTRIKLFSQNNCVYGMLLQSLPEATNLAIEENLSTFINKISQKNLLAICLNQEKIFPNEEISLYEKQPVTFFCPCSVERSESAIKLYGKEEAENILNEHHVIVVTCEFCNTHYEFSRDDVKKIFNKK